MRKAPTGLLADHLRFLEEYKRSADPTDLQQTRETHQIMPHNHITPHQHRATSIAVMIMYQPFNKVSLVKLIFFQTDVTSSHDIICANYDHSIVSVYNCIYDEPLHQSCQNTF